MSEIWVEKAEGRVALVGYALTRGAVPEMIVESGC